MARIVVIHPDAEEISAGVGLLERDGHDVTVFSSTEESAHRTLAADPPAAFVVDLDRRPSHGRALAIWLRQRKVTRLVPIVFVGGTAETVGATKKSMPDAEFATWRGVRGALRRALASPPARPIVPGTMDGYSGTPLAKKLGLRGGTRMGLLGAPADFVSLLDPLPEDVRITRRANGAELIVLFAKTRAEMTRRFASAAARGAPGGTIWIAWPKKASGVSTDLTQADVRAYGLDAGWVDFKICAIDATWSALRFSRRKEARRPY